MHGSATKPTSTGSEMPRVWLIGMMGSGKSVVGRRLADRLAIDFFDTDSVVEHLAGRSIESLWAAEGEEAFRRLESMCVERLIDVNAVVSTGGGVVLRPENVDVMRSSGPVIWLRASARTLVDRLGNGRRRPLLGGADLDVKVRELVAQRAEAYEGAATVILDTDEMSTEEVVDAIEALL